MRLQYRKMLRALSILVTSMYGPALAQETGSSTTPTTSQQATAEGIAVQSMLPAMVLTRAMFLDMSASADAGLPVARDDNRFDIGERIAIYTKFANVGRIYPGALDGQMQIETSIRVIDESGRVIINQLVQGPEREAVPYPYESPIPAAYFDSFKLNLLALPIAGTFTIELTFTDKTRPAEETQPVVVTLEAIVG